MGGPASVGFCLLPCASHFSVKYPGACAVTKLYVHSFHIFVDGLLCTTSSVLTDEVVQQAEMDKVSVFLEFRMQSGTQGGIRTIQP